MNALIFELRKGCQSDDPDQWIENQNSVLILLNKMWMNLRKK